MALQRAIAVVVVIVSLLSVLKKGVRVQAFRTCGSASLRRTPACRTTSAARRLELPFFQRSQEKKNEAAYLTSKQGSPNPCWLAQTPLARAPDAAPDLDLSELLKFNVQDPEVSNSAPQAQSFLEPGLALSLCARCQRAALPSALLQAGGLGGFGLLFEGDTSIGTHCPELPVHKNPNSWVFPSGRSRAPSAQALSQKSHSFSEPSISSSQKRRSKSLMLPEPWSAVMCAPRQVGSGATRNIGSWEVCGAVTVFMQT